jgi:Type I phosphodiesterase / nucleotide pyrophosphatase
MWGLLWGVALGMWWLAPKVIETHRIRPDGALQWFVVIVGLTVISALIGSYLSVLGSFVLAVLEKAFLGRFRDRNWAYGLFSGVIVVIAYALQSFLIFSMSFRSFNLGSYLRPMAGIAAFCVMTSAICVVLYRQILARVPRPRSSLLAWTLIGVAFSGVMSNLLSASLAAVRESDGALERLSSSHDVPPLLFIGLDGGTWRVLDRAIEDGSAPTLRNLVARGRTGTVQALWPPHWSGAAWAAILTGLPREETGVYEDLAAMGPGLPIMQVPLDPDPRLNPFYVVRAFLRAGGLIRFMPPPRALLRGKPVWQLLHEAHVDAAVVRFRFTYPPEGQASVVVSDWVGKDQWENLGVKRPSGSETVTPSSRADELLAPFLPEAPSDPELFGKLLPGPEPRKPDDALLDPIQELRIASDIDDRTFRVSESILARNPHQPFLAVYIGGLDSVEHAFWQYRFPEDYSRNKPAPQDVERLGPVLDRYVSYVDRRLQRLLSLYASTPNVLIVSDHGHGAAVTVASWRGWHTKEGIFIAAGPSVPARQERIDVSYYDVLPTIAWLQGFRSRSATGRSLVP